MCKTHRRLKVSFIILSEYVKEMFSGGDLKFSGDIRFKSCNGNISFLLYTESMEILLIEVHNVIIGEI